MLHAFKDLSIRSTKTKNNRSNSRGNTLKSCSSFSLHFRRTPLIILTATSILFPDFVRAAVAARNNVEKTNQRGGSVSFMFSDAEKAKKQLKQSMFSNLLKVRGKK